MNEKENIPQETAAQPAPAETVVSKEPEARSEAAGTKGGTKAKAPKTSKPDVPSVLKAVGLEICRLHGLQQVWVTDDGQCFPVEGDAKAHAANLKNKKPIKVTAE